MGAAVAWWLHLAVVAAVTGGEEDRRPRILHPSLRLSLLPQPAAAAAALTSSTTAAVVEVTEKAHTPCFSLLLSPLPLQAATAAPASGSSDCNWRQWQAGGGPTCIQWYSVEYLNFLAKNFIYIMYIQVCI